MSVPRRDKRSAAIRALPRRISRTPSLFEAFPPRMTESGHAFAEEKGSARFQRAAFGILANASLSNVGGALVPRQGDAVEAAVSAAVQRCLSQDATNGPQDAGAPQLKKCKK